MAEMSTQHSLVSGWISNIETAAKGVDSDNIDAEDKHKLLKEAKSLVEKLEGPEIAIWRAVWGVSRRSVLLRFVIAIWQAPQNMLRLLFVGSITFKTPSKAERLLKQCEISSHKPMRRSGSRSRSGSSRSLTSTRKKRPRRLWQPPQVQRSFC